MLIGQNLGFADGRMYAHGSPFDDLRYEVRDGVVHTTGASKEIGPMPATYRAGYPPGERDVLSNHSFDVEADWLARAAKVVPIVNCSEGGAWIPFSETRPLRTVLDRLEDAPRLLLEMPQPADTSGVVDGIRKLAERYLAAPTREVPADFQLLFMYAAPLLLMQGRDDQATRGERLIATMTDACKTMLEILD